MVAGGNNVPIILMHPQSSRKLFPYFLTVLGILSLAVAAPAPGTCGSQFGTDPRAAVFSRSSFTPQTVFLLRTCRTSPTEARCVEGTNPCDAQAAFDFAGIELHALVTYLTSSGDSICSADYRRIFAESKAALTAVFRFRPNSLKLLVVNSWCGNGRNCKAFCQSCARKWR